MIELLALPTWDCPETSLERWVDQFKDQGLAATLRRERGGETWIEVLPLRLQGYAVVTGEVVEAINFELHAIDTQPAREALEAAAVSLSWELHEEDGDDPDDDEDDRT